MTKINFANNTFILVSDGSVYWPRRKTLILGDLHLEKSSFYAKLGDFLPPYDSYETLSKLDKTLNTFDIAKIILLGDIFHDNDGMKRLNSNLNKYLEYLCTSYNVIWIVGNHDGGHKPLNTKLYLRHDEENISFVHKAERKSVYEFSGHYHPKATINFYQKRISNPCFLVGKSKIIMPAYGVFTGGIDSSNKIFKKVIGGSYEAYIALEKKLIKIKH
ncbi:ligase-associated DNA damage response endonuclease PdeM [Alphaproteobacteria bacterium]|nr:ligase-associated DNA damage response endonuclease PdeM [Alphaproteobacteria bacterium]